MSKTDLGPQGNKSLDAAAARLRACIKKFRFGSIVSVHEDDLRAVLDAYAALRDELDAILPTLNRMEERRRLDWELEQKTRKLYEERLEAAEQYIHALENAERGDAESEHHLSSFREEWERFGGLPAAGFPVGGPSGRRVPRRRPR